MAGKTDRTLNRIITLEANIARLISQANAIRCQDGLPKQWRERFDFMLESLEHAKHAANQIPRQTLNSAQTNGEWE